MTTTPNQPGPAGMRTGLRRNVYAHSQSGRATAADLDGMRREIAAAGASETAPGTATMTADDDRESMRRQLRAAGITPNG